jgi:hypothetical protein
MKVTKSKFYFKKKKNFPKLLKMISDLKHKSKSANQQINELLTFAYVGLSKSIKDGLFKD